ncbi:LacI family DNA-binding transcriptional regulator [Nocardioides soli]|uniref:DNA-binding LacI/PurR family transcriptional regulator n=1 Tax=Nocardioides soli TaxID=1036020 RepID=A0A7W4VV19_9ACTN|nr:LacI family DNA-binding transcriptional regulator [Nocardioides soli]MBB3042295.1 DNA-binding LacI/PurR family transcriptional regulator [Nocardioides soli]
MTTISDVARLAGVSPATVSRVLNRPEIVAEVKRELVLAAIKELGFEPSTSARSLRTGSTRSIALLVGDISQSFHGALAKSVATEAEAAGYSVLLGDLDHRRGRLLEFLRSIVKRNVDGVVIATAEDITDPEVSAAIARLVAQGVAVVSTVQGVPDMNVPRVGMDYHGMGEEAVRHLTGQGRRHLVYVGAGESPYSSMVGAGARAASESGGATLRTVDASFQAGPARDAIRSLLAEGHAIDGIVAANTPMAIGSLRGLTEAGRIVPDDVALISCESVSTADFVTPTLSTIGCDLGEYGRAAARAVIDAAEGREVRPDIRLDFELIVRESSAPVRAPRSTD